MWKFRILGVAMAWLSLCSVDQAAAQSEKMQSIPIPAQPTAILLKTGKLPSASAQESWHRQYGSQFARNVTEATLTPFLPSRAKATGAAVIVAPGGGFRTLSMQNEGWDVAKALADRGIAAFVLKYRLNQTPATLRAFEQSMNAVSAGATSRRPRPSGEQTMAKIQPQIADAQAAFALVRAKSKAWHVDPKRIGMVGFSAGAVLTMGVALGTVNAKPAFIGNIYGPLDAVTVPSDAPPLFVALAADDPIFAGRGMGLIDRWMAAKRPVEFHLYGRGGHGFGMYPKETTSTGWFDAFYQWIVMNGFIQPSTR